MAINSDGTVSRDPPPYPAGGGVGVNSQNGGSTLPPPTWTPSSYSQGSGLSHHQVQPIDLSSSLPQGSQQQYPSQSTSSQLSGQQLASTQSQGQLQPSQIQQVRQPQDVEPPRQSKLAALAWSIFNITTFVLGLTAYILVMANPLLAPIALPLFMFLWLSLSFFPRPVDPCALPAPLRDLIGVSGYSENNGIQQQQSQQMPAFQRLPQQQTQPSQSSQTAQSSQSLASSQTASSSQSSPSSQTASSSQSSVSSQTASSSQSLPTATQPQRLSQASRSAQTTALRPQRPPPQPSHPKRPSTPTPSLPQQPYTQAPQFPRPTQVAPTPTHNPYQQPFVQPSQPQHLRHAPPSSAPYSSPPSQQSLPQTAPPPTIPQQSFPQTSQTSTSASHPQPDQSTSSWQFPRPGSTLRRLKAALVGEDADEPQKNQSQMGSQSLKEGTTTRFNTSQDESSDFSGGEGEVVLDDDGEHANELSGEFSKSSSDSEKQHSGSSSTLRMDRNASERKLSSLSSDDEGSEQETEDEDTVLSGVHSDADSAKSKETQAILSGFFGPRPSAGTEPTLSARPDPIQSSSEKASSQQETSFVSLVSSSEEEEDDDEGEKMESQAKYNAAVVIDQARREQSSTVNSAALRVVSSARFLTQKAKTTFRDATNRFTSFVKQSEQRPVVLNMLESGEVNGQSEGDGGRANLSSSRRSQLNAEVEDKDDSSLPSSVDDDGATAAVQQVVPSQHSSDETDSDTGSDASVTPVLLPMTDRPPLEMPRTPVPTRRFIQQNGLGDVEKKKETDNISTSHAAVPALEGALKQNGTAIVPVKAQVQQDNPPTSTAVSAALPAPAGVMSVDGLKEEAATSKTSSQSQSQDEDKLRQTQLGASMVWEFNNFTPVRERILPQAAATALEGTSKQNGTAIVPAIAQVQQVPRDVLAEKEEQPREAFLYSDSNREKGQENLRFHIRTFLREIEEFRVWAVERKERDNYQLEGDIDLGSRLIYTEKAAAMLEKKEEIAKQVREYEQKHGQDIDLEEDFKQAENMLKGALEQMGQLNKMMTRKAAILNRVPSSIASSIPAVAKRRAEVKRMAEEDRTAAAAAAARAPHLQLSAPQPRLQPTAHSQPIAPKSHSQPVAPKLRSQPVALKLRPTAAERIERVAANRALAAERAEANRAAAKHAAEVKSKAAADRVAATRKATVDRASRFLPKQAQVNG